MTIRLRDPSGAMRNLAVGGRRPFVIGVATIDDVATTLRRVVHADLLRRVAERHRAVVTVVPTGPVHVDATYLTSYNCRPFGEGAPDIVVGVDVAPPDDGAPLDLAADPLVLRLAMLRRDSSITAAGVELSRWRHSVASWSESPSLQLSAEHVIRCHAALDDDLEVQTVLAVLREVEVHPGLAAGSRFETFAHLDTLVGLDLTSEVGQVPLWAPQGGSEAST